MGGGRITEERIQRGNGTLEDFIQKPNQFSTCKEIYMIRSRNKRTSLDTFINKEQVKNEESKYKKLKRILEALTSNKE